MSVGTIPTRSPLIVRDVSARVETRTLTLSIARGLLIATLLAAPLALGAVQPWAWASLTVSAVVLLLLWAAGQVQNGRATLVWSPFYLPALLFLALALVQYFSGLTLDRFATREALIKLTTDVLLFFLAFQLFGTASSRTLRTIGLVVTIFAFTLALVAILQYFSSHGLIYWVVKPRFGGDVFGPYVNRNHYAGLLEMLIPIAACYVLSQAASGPSRGLLGFAALVPVASLLLSGSRGGVIALSAEILILATVLIWRGSFVEKRRVAVGSLIAVAAATLLFFWMDPGEVSRRLETVANATDSPDVTLGDRAVAAADSLRIFRAHPWMGTGLGSFEVVYPRFQTILTDRTWEHAHNDYAEALAESGIVGGVLMIWAFVLFFRFAFRDLSRRLEQVDGWIQLGAAVGLCGLLVHSLLDFNLRIPANAAWFVALVALATTRRSPAQLEVWGDHTREQFNQQGDGT